MRRIRRVVLLLVLAATGCASSPARPLRVRTLPRPHPDPVADRASMKAVKRPLVLLVHPLGDLTMGSRFIAPTLILRRPGAVSR